MRRASNSQVSEIEVEVDSPAARGRKKDNVRSNSGTGSISGSGDSGTLKSNSSSGNWYLETVRGYALDVSSGGTVGVKVHVKDSGGNVKSELGADVHNGFNLDFGGIKVKPGWDIDYTIEQSDANSYTVEMTPLVRKPSPSDPSTVDETSVIDSFEDGSISEYSGDTGNFSTVSTDSYHLDNSLACSAAAESVITSTTGLDTYPEKGDSFSWHMKTTSLSDADDAKAGMHFGVQDSNNYYTARVNYDDRKLFFTERVGGTFNIVDESDLGSGFEADRWDRFEVQWGDTVTLTAVSGDEDSTMASLSIPYTSFDTLWNSGGAGWFGTIENSETIRYDNAVIR